MNTLNRYGRWIFSFAIVALGAENIVRAHDAHSIPALPFLPPIPWLAILFGILWIACGVGLLIERWLRPSAYTLGATYIFWTLVHVVPQYIANPGDMGLRTIVFEPLSLACIALLLPGPAVTPKWLTLTCRAIIAIAMIVFGVDHFLGLVFIASLIPGWIPWHDLLGRLLRRRLYRRRHRHWLRLAQRAELGRVELGGPRPYVRYLGHHASHPAHSRLLPHSRRY